VRTLCGLGWLLLFGCAPAAPAPHTSATTLPSLRPATQLPLLSSPASTAAAPGPITPTPVPSSPPFSPAPTFQFFVYFFPVQPSEVCDYSEGTQGHGYPATDIFCPTGTEFVAVTDGLVDFVSTEDRWDPDIDDPGTRGGLAVAIIGDDGIRYYGSHLSEVEPGVAVGAGVSGGQLLGKVGSTGDARGRDPHLHFGISRPTYPEDWHTRRGEVDPFSYLEAWEIKIFITPRLP
jgi:peptidoglycan LD-endopeptidase LytH